MNHSIEQYTWRSAQAQDVPALYQMLVANMATDQPETPPSTDRIQRVYDVLEKRIEQDTLIAIAQDGIVAAFGFAFFPSDEDEHLALVNGNVHVAHRRRGTGDHIIDWLETRARQEFQSLNDSVPQIYRTSRTAHQTDRITLFEQHGLKAMRYSYTMRCDLTQPILKTVARRCTFGTVASRDRSVVDAGIQRRV